MQAVSAEKAVTKSRPVPSNSRNSRAKVNTYTEQNPHTASTTRSPTGLLPNLTGNTPLVCSSRLISRTPCLNTRTTRITFMPPPVEPAQAPTKLAYSSMNGSTEGQEAKSVTVKPEVVAMESVVNAAKRNDTETTTTCEQLSNVTQMMY